MVIRTNELSKIPNQFKSHISSSIQFKLESLILAQNERWRRA